jgi:UDP-N-acetylmuramoyl-tripeptide--D-alanyl-D-alanine ligase
VGLVEGEPWDQIVAGLQDIAAQLRLIAVPGIKGSTIIDDTYNASPTSTLAALNLLSDLEGRKIAVLGDMLELGSYEERGHRLVGRRAAETVDKLVTVGPRGRIIAEEAQALGMDEADLFPMESNQEAVKVLRRLIRSGDLILIKGSRGMKMEEIVAKLGGK